MSAFEYEIPNASISEAQLDFDPATQAELDAHITDATDAHDASAISIIDAAGDFTATEVEGALAELQSDAEADAQALADHLSDAADAHDASAVSVLDTATNFTGTDVEAVLAELQDNIDAVGGGGPRSIPIDLHTPRTSTLAGNSFFTVVTLTDYDAGHWEFVLNVEGKVYGQVRIPDDYASGGVIRLALAANATSGVTRMQVGTKAVADGEALNPGALTDETAADVTMPGTAYFREDVTFTLTEALAAGDLLIVEVFHDGDHANDTLAVNTMLFGAWLEYTA